MRPELGVSLEEFDAAMDRENFIGSRVFPFVEVDKPAGPFGRLKLEQLLRNPKVGRASDGKYNRIVWTFGTDSYACKEYGLSSRVDEHDQNMYRGYFDLEAVTAAMTLDMVLRAAEIRIAEAVFNATVWTGAALTTEVTTEWSTIATATPRADVKAAKKKVRDGSGLRANTLIINENVLENLRDCVEILDRVKYQNKMDVRPSNIEVSAIAQALGIDQILVGGGIKNTANEGQTPVLGDIWSGEYAMVCRVAQTQSVKEPCIGRTLHWAEDGSTPGGLVETYRDEDSRADMVRVRHDLDEKRMLTAAGHLLSNITA
jgi:hypothetical protein